TATAILVPPAQITGTSGNDTITLTKDPDMQHIDWTMGASGGKVMINDAAGLTINGNGGRDAITLNYGSGNANPLPNVLHLNGIFTINGLGGTDPLATTNQLATTNLDIGRSNVDSRYSSSAP